MLKRLQHAGNTYSPHNINIFNELFYRCAERKLINELPNLFSKLDLFNLALHKKIITETKSSEIRVIELASGKKMNRWKTFTEIDKKRKWKVLLTDFDKSLLPNPNTISNAKNFKFTTNTHNLFDHFEKLKSNKRHNVMLSSYTFDNLWQKDDLHLTKENNTWYKNLYQLDLSKVRKSLGEIKDNNKFDRQFFKRINIKTEKVKINLSSLKHGALVDKYYENKKRVAVNFPGGLIKTVVDSYKTQLSPGGIFITADFATVDNKKKTKAFESVNETIKIKVENYALAQYILEKLGFHEEIKSVYEFIKEAGIITPVEIHDHFILSIKKK